MINNSVVVLGPWNQDLPTNIRRTNPDKHKDFILYTHEERHVLHMYIGPQIMPRNGITNYNNS